MDRAAITVSANRIIRNFSTALNFRAAALNIGVNSHRQIREIIPPIKLDRIPIFRALSPSPRFAIG